jgi:hypothetical protein
LPDDVAQSMVVGSLWSSTCHPLSLDDAGPHVKPVALRRRWPSEPPFRGRERRWGA